MSTVLDAPSTAVSVKTRLKNIKREYKEIITAIRDGALCDAEDRDTIMRLMILPFDVRNMEIIKHPEIPGNDHGKHWNISHARVSQIRTAGDARIYNVHKRR